MAPTERVRLALLQCGVDANIITLADSTRTAAEAAAAIGCRVAQIAKSILFRGCDSGEPVLVIASGGSRIVEACVESLVGEPVEKADADYVRARTGFVIGGVPPLGHVQPIRTFVDEELLKFEMVWASAGTQHAVFSLSPNQLLQFSSAVAVRVK